LKFRKGVASQDYHFPYQDDSCVDAFFRFIKKEKPDDIFFGGDIADFYQLSRFDKDPNRMSPKSFAFELLQIREFFCRCRKTCPEANIVFIEGNHEARLQKYLNEKCPVFAWEDLKEFEDLPSLRIRSLFGLEKYNIIHRTDHYKYGKFIICHGDVVRKHAGYSAKAEFDRNGCNGLSGHTHRDGKYSVRNRGGNWVWYENYCMCDLQPSYIKGVSNWSQGFSSILLVDGSPRVEQIPIIHGQYVYGGKVQ